MSSFKKRYCLKQRFGKHLCQIQHFQISLFICKLPSRPRWKSSKLRRQVHQQRFSKATNKKASRKCALLYKKYPFEVHIRQNRGILEILFANSAMLINCFNHPIKNMTNTSNSTKDIEPLFAFIFDNLVHGSL